MAKDYQGTPIPPRSPLPFTGVSKRKRSVFYTQLARMLNAGISPVRALTTLAGQGGSWRLSRAARDMTAHIQSGGNLASAFAGHPNLFPTNEVRMIGASELAGKAGETMLRISKFLDMLANVQRQLATKMLYPALCLLLVLVGIPNAMAFFGVIPPVWHYYAVGLPGLVLAVLVLMTVWRSLTAMSALRLVVHSVVNAVPVLGKIVRRIAWARFASTLECLYAAGVVTPNALALAATSCGNAAVEQRLLRAVPLVREGGSITDALISTRALPRLATDMIQVGEDAGKLEEALHKFAEYQEQDATVAIQRLSTVLFLVVLLGYISIMLFMIFTIAASYGKMLDSVMQ